MPLPVQTTRFLHELLQDADLSEWQNELLESEDEDGKAGRGFWRDQQILTRPALSLPFEATPGAEISFELDLVELSFDPEKRRQASMPSPEIKTPVFLPSCWPAGRYCSPA